MQSLPLCRLNCKAVSDKQMVIRYNTSITYMVPFTHAKVNKKKKEKNNALRL